MNYNLVGFLLGKLCFVLGGAMGIPLLVSVFLQEVTWQSFMLSIASCLLAGKLLTHYGNDEAKDTITFREGVAVVSGTWFLITFLGGLPYWFAGELNLISAFFESVSGFTTTGATTITHIEQLTKSMQLWRSLTHWMGGIGIVVWFIALLPNLGAGVVHMYNAEVTGATEERVLPRIRETTIVLCKIYVILTSTLAILLFLAGMTVFESINHAFSTIATGGFSTLDTSITGFHNQPIEFIISVFMVLAGGNFALYYAGYVQGWKTLWKDTEFKVYIWIVAGATLLITANLAWKMNFALWDAFRFALFQVASIISTTGFVSNDFDLWPSFSKYILIMLMLIGACAGSTAGGIKVSRITILCKTAGGEIKKVLHPSAIINVKMSGHRVPSTVIAGICRFFFLFMFLFALLTLLLALTGLSVTDSIAIIAATISSVGPALGIAGPTCTYAPISGFGKFVICLAMLLGRLELFTLMVMLRKEFWSGNRRW